MNTPEERLRDALAASAALVQAEEAPVAAPRPAPRHRAGRLIPAVAAVTVLVVTILGLSLRPDGTHAPVTPPGPAPDTAAAPYFLANVTGGDNINEATVRDVRTGAVKATVNRTWTAMSATADPHTFYLGAQGTSVVIIYRLVIDDNGRLRSLTRLTAVGSGASGLLALAASPDGSRVASAVLNDPAAGGGAYGPAEIDVLDLATHRRTVYQSPEPGRVSELSWAADGRHLAFHLEGASARTNGIWILDTRAGRSLLAASHQVLGWAAADDETYTTPVLSADASRVFVIAAQKVHGHNYTQIIELDARTGRWLRVVFQLRYSGDPGNVDWMFTLLTRDPTGRSLLASGPTTAYVIDVGSGRSTAIPVPRGAPNVMAW